MITSSIMSQQPSILTVSQLNRQVKSYLESELGFILVQGEISNLTRPSSGHLYFTLKDESAQLRCVFFRNRHSSPIAYKLADGQMVVAAGRLSLYEARGDYQLIVEELTDTGLGALYKRFEELKAKLATEGLFDSDRKKTIPTIPETIGIITSPTGAALQDILSTLARRYPLAKVLIYPSEVQGISAPNQLIAAIKKANRDQKAQVLILARGGGSIEDLWAFNDEQLARTIAASSLPIVSGVGHETDFTIADFVADLRAETPTAAAIAITPDKMELIKRFEKLSYNLESAVQRILHLYRIRILHLQDKLVSPKKTIAMNWQRLDYLERQLVTSMDRIVKQLKFHLNTQLATMHAVSPLATLDRGYAIAYKNNKILHKAVEAKIGDIIGVRLAQGLLTCEVLEVKES